ncbi:MAG TPA: hypothetical protein VHA06_09065 [Candidatus Angelobacter sp.]|jgi:hypothetical protein|nr:hypothetical protein [Candidatus Angelobacter sp.]
MSKQVTTSLTIDLAAFWETGTWTVTDRKFYEYSGTWMLAKGDSTVQASETQQADFNSQLMQMMQSQYGLQSSQLAFLNGILKPMVENPTGLGQKDLTAMRTSASDTIAQQGANATQAVQAKEAAGGNGTGLPSGAQNQINAGIATATGVQQASAQNQITQYDASVKQQNFWNAVQGLSGNAAMLNPQSYAGLANQGEGSLAGLAQTNYNTQQSGWLNAALGGLGSAAGGWASGGFKMP